MISQIICLLKCPICSNTFDGCVSLPCGHSFCSFCYRSYARSALDCPICKTKLNSLGDLTVNKLVNEIVDLVSKIPSGPSSALSSFSAPKEAKDSVNICTQTEETKADLEILEMDIPLKHGKRPRGESGPDSIVACPICWKNVLMKYVNGHIESACVDHVVSPSRMPETIVLEHPLKTLKYSFTNPGSSTAGPIKDIGSSSRSTRGSSSIIDNSTRGSPHIIGSSTRGPSQVNPIQKPKPSPAYNFLKDASIRTLLNDDGIPSKGDRKTLIKRHQDWVMRYNANLDRSQPLSDRDMRVEFTRLESEAIEAKSNSTLVFRKGQENSEEVVGHSLKYADEFDSLRQQILDRKNPKSVQVSHELPE